MNNINIGSELAADHTQDKQSNDSFDVISKEGSDRSNEKNNNNRSSNSTPILIKNHHEWGSSRGSSASSKLSNSLSPFKSSQNSPDILHNNAQQAELENNINENKDNLGTSSETHKSDSHSVHTSQKIEDQEGHQLLQSTGTTVNHWEGARFQQHQLPQNALDVVLEYQRGNFLPALHCLRQNLIPGDYIDKIGYSILHHAVCHNNADTVLMLLDYFKLDVNTLTQTKQTCAMIAAHFGFVEILKIVVDRGCDINAQDNMLFTASLYAVKQANPTILFYLMSKGANLDLADTNGCTIVHWAAYKNDVFLLRMFHQMELPMNQMDLMGFTPLQRAIGSEAIDVLRYFLEELHIEPPSKNLDTIPNLTIKQLVLNYLPNTAKSRGNIADRCSKHIRMHPQKWTLSVYVILMFLSFLTYYLVVINKGELHYIFHIVLVSATLYCLLYFHWYYLKSEGAMGDLRQVATQSVDSNYFQEQNESIGSYSERELKPTNQYKQDRLDMLINRGEQPSYAMEKTNYPYPSFLHEVYFDIERGDFDKVALFDAQRYHSTTLLPKKHKSKFCKKTKRVLERYNHYSYALGRPVERSSHPFYILMLLKQMCLVGSFIGACIYSCYDKRTSWITLVIPETAFMIMVEHNWLLGLVFVLDVILFVYSLFYLMVEIYCVARNLTYDELYNSYNYPYLYRINRIAAAGTEMIKVFYNPNDKGVLSNFQDYVIRTFRFDELV